MDDTKLWLIGALALVVVVAALIWVLRQRDGATDSVSYDYSPPEVTGSGGAVPGGVSFGEGTTDDTEVDQTVPRSRLGGAGWRDGSDVPPQPTTNAYAAPSPSWGDDESVVAADQTLDHHVEVDNTGPRPVTDEIDKERGGHW